MDAEARHRAIEFMSVIDDACAERTPACPGGRVLLDSRHPRLWSANHVRVEALDAPAAAALDAAAARHLDPLGFRMIAVLDERAGRALGEPLAALGYRAAHELLMVGGGRCPAPDPGAPVVELAHEDLQSSRIASQVEAGRDPEVGRQLASRDALIAGVVAVRRLAIVADGEIAARVQIHARGSVAQLENLYTAPRHRGRGLARVLAEHAVAEARAAGAQLVFGIADADGWPRTFYRRLGFADAGLLPRFLRP